MRSNRERNERFFEQTKVQAPSGVRGGIQAGAGAAPRQAKGYMKQARQTGQINLSNRNLDSCPKDIFYIDDNLEPDEKYWEIVPITKLDLSHNAIKFLPDDVERLAEAMTTFKIRDNSLVELPEGLYQCVQLRHLDLAMNRLSRLSEKIGCLPCLREALLGCNELVDIPSSLSNCVGLQLLELQENKLRQFRGELCIVSLLHLNLSSNQLVEIPEDISRLSLLISLQVKKNSLTRLPDLRALSKLTFLDASENRIDRFPVLPQNTSCLDRVILGNNRIQSIEINHLVPHLCGCLTELHMNDNSLTDIPYNIGLLSCCKLLDFSNNSIADIPAAIGWMNELARFGAEGNPVRSIRRTILTQSTVELKNYLRTRGPPASATEGDGVLGGSTSTVLGAATRAPRGRAKAGSNSQFDYDPFDPELQIKDDDIFSQRIRAIHSNILDLSKLQCSELPRNLLQKLQMSHAFDSESMTLVGVGKLNLSDNCLTEVPVHILAELPQLTELILSNNTLGLGPIISRVEVPLYPPSLRLLDVSKCKLSTSHLLLFILHGKNLTELRASNNAIDQIPSEIASVMNNLRELKLSNNNISSIGNVDFAKLTALEILDLADNKLSDISPLLRSLFIPGTSSRSSGSRLSSIMIDNNNVKEISGLFSRFPRLQHLGLFGNPQKTIRSNLLGNFEAIRKYLENRVSDADEQFLTGASSSVLPSSVITNRQQSHPTTDECFIGENFGEYPNDSYRQRISGSLHDRDRSRSTPSEGPTSSNVNGGNSKTTRPAYDLPPQQLPQRQYRPEYESMPPDVAQRRGSYDSVGGQRGGISSIGSMRGAEEAPTAVVASNRSRLTEQGQYHQYQSKMKAVSAVPPADATYQSTPNSSSTSNDAVDIQRVRAEITMLEREMDDLSISVSRKAQVKRSLALNRALLLKLLR